MWSFWVKKKKNPQGFSIRENTLKSNLSSGDDSFHAVNQAQVDELEEF